MPGGTFTAQNKIRPGAYINFKSVPRPLDIVGDRGIVSFPMALSWGAEGALIDVYSEDMLDDVASVAAIGLNAFDAGAKVINAALSYAYLARIYRMDKGGTAAKTVIGDLTVTARYAGELGNSIVMVVEKEDTLFIVSTYVRGALRDTQKVSKLGELDDNRFVKFSGAEGAPLIVIAEAPLTGGTNGTVTEETAYQGYEKLLKDARIHTFAVPSDNTGIKEKMAVFAEKQRDEEGRYIQAVVSDYAAADHESTINVKNSVTIEGASFTKEEATILVAGLNAGCPINESNTGRVIRGATGLVDGLTHSEIAEGLRRGWFIFSSNMDGAIKVEQDINSLHTFIPEKGREFRKNRVVRALDEMGTAVKSLWETTHMGTVNNDEDGRGMLRANIVSLINARQARGVFRDFGGADDVMVRQGTDGDAVVCEVAVKPLDSMEFLYMTVNLLT